MISIQNLSAGYNGKKNITGINTEFQQGKLTTIIGPNGSGKSTLLKAVAGLSEVMSGEIMLSKKPKRDISGKDFAQKVFYFPQSRTTPALSVERMVLHARFPYLSYPRTYRENDIMRCEEAMRVTGIFEKRNQRLEELSGGERQKAYLAMVFCSDADVFLLDEPTTYLDINYQLEFFSLMKKIKDEGKTVVSVLHDLSMALCKSDRLILLSEGELKADMPAEKLYKSGLIKHIFGIESGMCKGDDGQTHYYFY